MQVGEPEEKIVQAFAVWSVRLVRSEYRRM